MRSQSSSRGFTHKSGAAVLGLAARRWGAPIRITRRIAAGAKGNVRAALGDLEAWMGDWFARHSESS